MKTEEQIKGEIADTESKLAALNARHDNLCRDFNQAVEANKAEHNQLVGRLTTLKELLPLPETPKTSG